MQPSSIIRTTVSLISTIAALTSLCTAGCGPGSEAGQTADAGPPADAPDYPPDQPPGMDDTTRTVFVHLFEWRWSDIASECELFLGPRGFRAVQISPPNEHISLDAWWARYQPVSYRLDSRSGTRAELVDMVERCNAAGVAIYADLVLNHTASYGGSGVGSAGTRWSYKQHPANPAYGPGNYHSTCPLDTYHDARIVQSCELVGLPDLDTAQDYVQEQMAAYMQDLLDIGVSGFRIDAAKHMAPVDIEGILARAGNPWVFLEVIGADGEAVAEDWYTHLGRVTEFGFSGHVGHRFQYAQLADLRDIAPGKLPSESAVVFTDNHDNQRGHGAGGDPVTFQDGVIYDLANVYMLAMPYGYPKIMSSYEFSNTDTGPPAGPGGCGRSGWVCEHRRPAMANMVGFRNTTDGEPLAGWWDNGNRRIAFGRGSKGFVAINAENEMMNETLMTGMPAGTYCNVALGDVQDGSCSGPMVIVDAGGSAAVQLDPNTAMAIHVNAVTGGM